MGKSSPEKQRLYSQRYREKNRTAVAARRKAAYAANATAVRAKSRAYYTANKDRAAAQAREYRKHNVDKRRMQKRRWTYGITVDAFCELWNLQAGRCAICLCRLVDDGSRQCHVDHDHTSGEVRGLLCVDCNVALGRFKDDPAAMRRAAEYVELGRLAPRQVFSNGRDGR